MMTLQIIDMAHDEQYSSYLTAIINHFEETRYSIERPHNPFYIFLSTNIVIVQS